MSIRFQIKNNSTKAIKEGETIVRFSGDSTEPFKRSSDRAAQTRSVDARGNDVFTFVTGLEEGQVDFYSWYSDEEKKSIKKQIKELRPLIAKYYGGENIIAPDNQYFWLKDRNVRTLSLTNEDVDSFFDTKNATHALLYLSIIGGAFEDLVAPTKEYAERNQIPHYLSLETEENYDDDDEITKSDAHAALAELRKDASPEALFILAWCVQYDTNAFGAYLRSTPVRELVSYHIKYIDGKIVTKQKKNTPKVFLDYTERWKGQQTRPALYVEAYVKAGTYYNFIQSKQKKFETADGTVLGNTIQEAVENLQKPRFSQDFEKLRDQVEAKWKE